MKLLNNNMKRILTAVLGAFLLISSCAEDKKPERTSVKEIEAEVVKVEKTVLGSDKEYSGTIKSNIRSEIGTKVLGEILQVPVNIGDRVAKGDLLLQIKDDDLQARKTRVQSSLEEAGIHLQSVERDYNRFNTLYEKGSATQKEWDDIQSTYQAAKTRVQAAESQLAEVEDLLSYTQIRAPYEGLVASKYIQEGDIARPGQPLLALEQVDAFKVEATIPESEIGLVAMGDTLQVMIPAVSETQWMKVSELSKSGDPQSRQFRLELIPAGDKLPETIHSGMFARVSLSGQGDAVLVVPEKALISRGQLTGVYTLNDQNEALIRWIRTGAEQEGKVEVLSGLKEGERVVLKGSAALYDGAKVAAIN